MATQTIQQSFSLLGYSLLLFGIFPFHVAAATRTKPLRILQLVYCFLFSFIHSMTIIVLCYTILLYFYKSVINHNVNMISFYLSSMITLKACLVQRVLYYWKSDDIIAYLNDWKIFESEYKCFTGKQLCVVNYRRFFIIFFLSTLAIIYVTFMAYLGETNQGTSVDIFAAMKSTAFFSVINLMRLYTELMWYMFASALRNAADQLSNDYRNEICQERGIDRTNYETLWMKLANLQSRLPKTFSSIYGYQLAINFLEFLFLGFVLYEFLYRYVTTDIFKTILLDPDERYSLIFVTLGLYGRSTTSFIYLWLGSSTAGSAQKALVDDTKRKLVGMLTSDETGDALKEQAKQFLLKVTNAETRIRFSGYGKIDRSFICKVLLTWIYYMTTLLQFKISFYEEDKDPTIRNKRSVENEDFNLFSNSTVFGSIRNTEMRFSMPFPFVLEDWYPTVSSFT